MRTKRIFLTAIVAVGIGLAGASLASAQSYPDRLIKIVVPYPPGGPADVAARLVTQPLSTKLGQSVIIENQPGGGGRTGAKFVAHASADGYTLLLGGTNPNAIASLYRTLDFEPIKDFAAVGLIAFDSNALVVNPAVPAKTLQELVQYAKANPGKLASGATVGIGPHVCLELFRVRTASSIVFIPYKGAAPAVADLLGGQIQIGMTSKAVLLPLIKEGRLRALAVTSDVRWARASGRADDGRKRIRRDSAVSMVGVARPGPNARRGDRQDQWRAQRRAEIARTPGEHRQARPANEKHDAARVRQQACR